MTYPRNTAEKLDDKPDFFLGVVIETSGIKEHATAVNERAAKLAGMVTQSVESRSIAALKAAIDANDSLGREIQFHTDRMRTLISHLDRKLAAHQSRRPRA